MDIETRGYVFSQINHVYENQNLCNTMKWICEIDDDIECLEDLTLGYFIGSLMQIGANTTSILKNNKFIKETIKKSHENYKKELQEIYGKEEGKIKFLKFKMKMEEPEKSGSPTIIEPSPEEIEEIRNMLIPIIPRFREKIRQERTLKKI